MSNARCSWKAKVKPGCFHIAERAFSCTKNRHFRKSLELVCKMIFGSWMTKQIAGQKTFITWDIVEITSTMSSLVKKGKGLLMKLPTESSSRVEQNQNRLWRKCVFLFKDSHFGSLNILKKNSEKDRFQIYLVLRTPTGGISYPVIYLGHSNRSKAAIHWFLRALWPLPVSQAGKASWSRTTTTETLNSCCERTLVPQETSS